MTERSYRTLAYVYFEHEPGRRSAANLLTRHEARRIAVNITKAAKPVARNLGRCGAFGIWTGKLPPAPSPPSKNSSVMCGAFSFIFCG